MSNKEQPSSKRSADDNLHYIKDKKRKEEDNEKKEIWGESKYIENDDISDENIVKEKANFGLTGIVLKWSEPLDACKPSLLWRFYVFKEDQLVETLHLHRKSSYLIGRDHRVADVIVAHPSCSSQHAVLQFRKVKKRDKESGETNEKVIPYLMDLQSANKTVVNGEVIDESRYYELREKDIIKFAFSTREYVLLHENSDS